MEVCNIVNCNELKGINEIKCKTLLKSSWNHSEFSGVVVCGEYFKDNIDKIMNINQMKALCNGNSKIKFVNVKNSNDVIFNYVNKNIGFAINMNSDTFTEIISSESEKTHPISLSPALQITEEYSKGFRISADNKVIGIDSYTDYELLVGLEEIIEKTKPSNYLLKSTDPREMAIELMSVFKLDSTEEMKVF